MTRTLPHSGLGQVSMTALAKQAPVPPPSGRQVPCEKCPLRDNPCLRDFTAKELAFVTEFKSGELNIEAGTNILLQGTNSAHLYTVLSGWGFRHKSLPDGRRQILNYALPRTCSVCKARSATRCSIRSRR